MDGVEEIGVIIPVGREINGDEDRLVVEEEEDEEDMYREVTSRDLGRRGARALSGSDGNRGGLVGWWFCVAAVAATGVVLGFIVVETAATIIVTKIQKLLHILFFKVHSSKTLIFHFMSVYHHKPLLTM